MINRSRRDEAKPSPAGLRPDQFFDDVSKMASGALGGLAGVRDRAEERLRRRVEWVLDRADVVSRDEFDAVRAVATKARLEQERLEGLVSALGQRLAALEAAADTAPTAKAAAAPKKRRVTKKSTKTSESDDSGDG